MSTSGDSQILERNKAFFREYVEDLYIKRDLDAVDRYIADDFKDLVPPNAPGGPDGYRQSLQAFFETFPDVTVELDHMMGEGNRIVGRLNFVGTHAGVWEGIRPTNRRVETFGLDIVRIENGKITERRVFRNEIGILKTLGMF